MRNVVSNKSMNPAHIKSKPTIHDVSAENSISMDVNAEDDYYIFTDEDSQIADVDDDGLQASKEQFEHHTLDCGLPD